MLPPGVPVSPVPFVRPVKRPAVLDAARTALIPLRPLTIGELLDGGFLIVRRNARLMLGLPLVIAGGTAAYVLVGVGLWVLLGNTTVRGAQIACAIVLGLVGLFGLVQCLVWKILQRVSQRSLVVILTGLDAAAVTEGLTPVLAPVRRKHKIVVAAVSDPRVDELVARRADAAEVYAAAAAEADRARRDRTASALRDLGLSVVHAPPSRFAPDLADHYLALKKAGQL